MSPWFKMLGYFYIDGNYIQNSRHLIVFNKLKIKLKTTTMMEKIMLTFEHSKFTLSHQTKL